MNITETIQEQIHKAPLGEPFISKIFLGCGSRAAVDQVLSRLVKNGKIKRLSRGVFVRPKKGRFTQYAIPNPIAVVESVAKSKGEIIQPHGAQAALEFGLTTQVPMQPVFYTNGSSRKISIGKMKVTFKHVSQRKLMFAGRPSGSALSALWYLGKDQITPEILAKIRKQLPRKEYNAIQAEKFSLPGWMTKALTQF